MCSHCGGKFKEIDKGWQCEDCLCVVDGVSFYQGRNSKEKEIIMRIDKMESEIDENNRQKYDVATLRESKFRIGGEKKWNAGTRNADTKGNQSGEISKEET